MRFKILRISHSMGECSPESMEETNETNIQEAIRFVKCDFEDYDEEEYFGEVFFSKIYPDVACVTAGDENSVLIVGENSTLFRPLERENEELTDMNEVTYDLMKTIFQSDWTDEKAYRGFAAKEKIRKSNGKDITIEDWIDAL